MSEFKTAADYIETVYGTRTFARALDCNDAMSIMDLMQDFSDYNLEKSHAPKMLEMLKKLTEHYQDVLNGDFSNFALRSDIDAANETIQKATTIK